MKKIITLILSLILILSLFPVAAFADSQSVTIKSGYNTTVNRNGSNYLTVLSKSSTNDGYRIVLVPQDDHISIKSGTSGIINSTEEKSSIFEIAAAGSALIGEHKIKIQARSTEISTSGAAITDPSEEGKLLQEYELKVMVVDNQESYYGPVQTATNISYTLSGGDAIYADEINSVTVSFFNRSSGSIRNAELSIKTPAGMTIYSGASSVYVGDIIINKTATASFPVVCNSNIQDGSYEITAILSGSVLETYGDQAQYVKKEISQSFFVPVKNGTASESTVTDVAKPILMVSNYSCGGSIIAGKNFSLTLTLLNTSKVKLQNIKVTLDPATGMVPVGSSNSFYIEAIPAGESVSKTITLASDRSMVQGYYPISVSMSYEDTHKASYSSSDTISVPVVQESRLVIDDILDPGWLTMSDQCYASVNYRNMGNNSINNLQIMVEGDFTMDQASTYFVGNLASGKQDYYSFNFWPLQAGPCLGKLTFVYEDADGTEHSVVKEFNFNIGEGYNWEDPGEWEDPIPEKFHMPIWGWIAIAVAAVVVLIIVLKIVKKRKAKKQEALDLDE